MTKPIKTEECKHAQMTTIPACNDCGAIVYKKTTPMGVPEKRCEHDNHENSCLKCYNIKWNIEELKNSTPLNTEEQIIITGVMGDIDGEKVYCNEKDRKENGFLFKCCKGCKHDTEENKELEWEGKFRQDFRDLLMSLDDLHIHGLAIKGKPVKGDIYFDGIETEQFLVNRIKSLLDKQKLQILKEILDIPFTTLDRQDLVDEILNLKTLK